MEREKGAVAASCPRHPDVDLEAQRMADGALAYSTCPQCSSEKASADAEQAPSREVGSHVDSGNDPLDGDEPIDELPEPQPIQIDEPVEPADQKRKR
jgi:hypothetical protein